MDRRLFLTSATTFLLAPAIVRAASIMPVRGLPDNGAWEVFDLTFFDGRGNLLGVWPACGIERLKEFTSFMKQGGIVQFTPQPTSIGQQPQTV